MPIDLNSLPQPNNVAAAIALGEGLQVELKEAIPHAVELARHVSAFANATGGWIIIGVRDNPRAVVGIDWTRLSAIFDGVGPRLNPVPDLTLHQVALDGRMVGVLVVKSSTVVIVSDAGTYIRDGAQIRPMTQAEIQAKLPPQPNQNALNDLAAALAHNTRTIDDLARELHYSQTVRGQLKSYVIGFVLGIIASIVASYVYAWLTTPMNVAPGS